MVLIYLRLARLEPFPLSSPFRSFKRRRVRGGKEGGGRKSNPSSILPFPKGEEENKIKNFLFSEVRLHIRSGELSISSPSLLSKPQEKSDFFHRFEFRILSIWICVEFRISCFEFIFSILSSRFLILQKDRYLFEIIVFL